MSRLSLLLLGAPRVERDGQPVSTDRRKAIALLAYLAVTGVAHTRDHLAALLWPDYDTAAAYLRRTLWEIREMVGDGWLETTRDQVRLHDQPGLEVDVRVFRACAAAARTAGTGAITGEEALAALAAAAALYQGDFMAGFTLRDSPAFDDWQRFEEESLRREAADVLRRLSEGHGARGDLPAAQEQARRWVALDPLQEAAHRSLMRLYAEAGDRAAALRQYELCVQALERELGAPPEAATTSLYEEIRLGRLARVVADAAPPQAQAAPHTAPMEPRHNLPAPLTGFVGRRVELDEIERLLMSPEARLVTVVGPGGIGKTRLALQAAHELLPVFPGGVWFVALAPLAAPEQIAPAVARALGLHLGDAAGTGTREQLLTALRTSSARRPMLLVLDNYEHLLADGGAAFAADVAAAAPGVRLLATSRVRLNVPGESLYPLLGMGMTVLTMGRAGGVTFADGAMTLFEQRAQAVLPRFALTPANRASVERICQLVQGFPLGIELAATWVDLLDPLEIVKEIERNLDFLAIDARDDRQRSIRAVFDSTWRLLTDAEQDAFRRLAVFRGRFTRSAAEAVAGATLRMLLALSHKSLVYRDVSDQSAERYILHELLRQYALERLREHPAVWDETHKRLARHYAQWLGAQHRAMQGPEQGAAFDAVGSEINNIRAAWLWAVEFGCADEAAEMLDALLLYYSVRTWRQEFNSLMAEGEALLPAAARLLSANDARLLRARMLGARIFFADAIWIMADPAPLWFDWMRFYEMSLSHRLLESGLQLYAEHPELVERVGLAGCAFAHTAFFMAHRDEGIALQEQLVARLRQEQATQGAASPHADLGLALYLLACEYSALGRLDEADARNAECLEQAAAAGDRLLRARAHILEAFINGQRRLPMDAALLKESLAIFVEMGALMEAARALGSLADEYDSMGDYALAVDHYAEARAVVRPLHDLYMDHSTLSWEALAALRLGRIDHARDRRTEALALAEGAGDGYLAAWSHWELGDIERVAGNVDACRRHWREGTRAFTELDFRNGLIYMARGRGELALIDGDLHAARAAFEESQRLALVDGHAWSACFALAALARVDRLEGDFAQSEEHLRAAMAVAREIDNRGLQMIVLQGWGALALARGDAALAAEVLAGVVQERSTWHEYRAMAQADLNVAVARLPADAAAAACARGRSHTRDSLAAQLL